MDHKFIRFDVKADGDSRVIAGRGSVFGNVDRGGDIVQAGAFSESLASGRKVAMLWQHDSREVIGVWTKVTQDADGLLVEGVLADTPRGNEAYTLLKMGAMNGLSIGYQTVDCKYQDDVRVIEKADLWEVSLVTFPMNELARIDAVKAAEMTKREFEQKLVRDAGFSQSVAKALMAGGYEAIQGKRDAADDGLDELRVALAARAKL